MPSAPQSNLIKKAVSDQAFLPYLALSYPHLLTMRLYVISLDQYHDHSRPTSLLPINLSVVLMS